MLPKGRCAILRSGKSCYILRLYHLASKATLALPVIISGMISVFPMDLFDPVYSIQQNCFLLARTLTAIGLPVLNGERELFFFSQPL